MKDTERMRVLSLLAWTPSLAQLFFNLLHVEHNELRTLVLRLLRRLWPSDAATSRHRALSINDTVQYNSQYARVGFTILYTRSE